MEVRVELFSGMERFKPQWAGMEAFSLKLPDKSTLYDLIRELDIPTDHPFTVLVNGIRVPYEEALKPYDKVSFLSPPAGG